MSIIHAPSLRPDGRNTDARVFETYRQKAIRNFIYVQIFSVIFLEKIALHVGGGEIQLVLPIFLVSLCALILKIDIRVDQWRLFSYLGFVAAAIFGHIFLTSEYSPTSMILVFILYLGMCFYVEVDEETYIRCMRFYNKTIVVISFITIYQIVTQYTIGNQYWGNLDRIIPESLQFSNYNYLQPIRWMSPYFKPNGFFILEVSFISQFVAIALMIEITFFRRPLLCFLYAGVIMLTFSGSGLLVLLFCAPAALAKLNPRMLLIGFFSLIAALIAASAIGWWDEAGSRISEFTTPGTSGYYRFTIPIMLFGELSVDPSYFISGNGAGTTLKGTVYLLLPFAKVVSEYGTLTFFFFYAFLMISLFHKAINWTVAYTVFVLYNLAGSTFALPMSIIVLIMLSTFFRAKQIKLASSGNAKSATRTEHPFFQDEGLGQHRRRQIR